MRNNNELYHYGVKGMKWGVRRYRNYDGSYTRAGVKRFDASLTEYEKADSTYKSAKKRGASKADVVNAKLARKKAKARLVKDYKHLKQDKLGDQGKELYANGKTITGNSAVSRMLETVGTLSLTAAAYNNQYGFANTEVTKVLAAVGVGSYAVSGAKRLADIGTNKRLRAYYGHTSNY